MTIDTIKGKVEVKELSIHEYLGITGAVIFRNNTYSMTETITGKKMFEFKSLKKADQLLREFIDKYGAENIKKRIK